MSSRLRLSLAISHYDHVIDLTSGTVRAEGIELVPLILPVEEIFYRFVHYREFDVSEMSFAKFVAMSAVADCNVIGLPVFPSRMFRQSALYVRAESDLSCAQDLRGKRVGIPEWAQTAQVYVRGWLTEDVGLSLTDIEWVQAGVNDAGRREKVALTLPSEVSLTVRPDTNLSQLLLNGEIDAISSAHPPEAFERGDGTMRRLLNNSLAEEASYFERTRIFPIMHVIAMRRDIYEANRWIAQSLTKAFGKARDRGLARALEYTASRSPVPWAAEHASRMQETFGPNLFPYGLQDNAATLTAFLRFCANQGLCQSEMAPEALFAPESLGQFRV